MARAVLGARFTPFKHGSVATNYTQASVADPVTRKLNKLFNRGYGNRAMRATVVALTGAAVGGASKAFSYARISAGNSAGQTGRNELGGRRTTETRNMQTGVTVAADLTDFDTRVTAKNRPASYPVDKSGHVPGKPNSLV